MASSGLHANGYSLVRTPLLDRYALDATPPGLDRTLAEELLEPCMIYAPQVRELAEAGLLNAAAHITGGGIIENVPRALPPGLGAEIRRGSWPEPAIFELVRSPSGPSRADLFSTFNMGLGMVLVVDPAEPRGGPAPQRDGRSPSAGRRGRAGRSISTSSEAATLRPSRWLRPHPPSPANATKT